MPALPRVEHVRRGAHHAGDRHRSRNPRPRRDGTDVAVRTPGSHAASRSRAASPPASRTACAAFAALGVPDHRRRRARARRGRARHAGLRPPSSRGSAASVLRPDGELDRAALGRLVFADARRAARPRGDRAPGRCTSAIARLAIAAHDAPGHSPAIADIPLLYETGPRARLRPRHRRRLPRRTRSSTRLMARDGLTRGRRARSASRRRCRSTRRSGAPTTSSTRQEARGDGPAGGRDCRTELAIAKG